jgi:hypothetical protein
MLIQKWISFTIALGKNALCDTWCRLGAQESKSQDEHPFFISTQPSVGQMIHERLACALLALHFLFQKSSLQTNCCKCISRNPHIQTACCTVAFIALFTSNAVFFGAQIDRCLFKGSVHVVRIWAKAILGQN